MHPARQPAAICTLRPKNLLSGFSCLWLLVLSFLLCGILLAPLSALAAITSITPVTWDVVGLDSNSPLSGPNRFPIGARVCSNTGETNYPVLFVWESANANINLSSRGALPEDEIEIDIPAGGCADAYFEVTVERTSAAFDTARRYYIEAGGLKTPQPRQLYVQKLVSQARNGITNLEFGPSLASLTSVPAGGSFSLIKGNTYFIRMSSYTAPGGYNQLETFSTLPNTIFQVLSVVTTYTADSTTNVSSPHDKLYGDACYWDDDPDSPNYLACNGDGKIGGTMTVTYEVKIIAIGAGGSQPINSLIYDLSGASYHYNSDYDSGGRNLTVVDPSLVTIEKSFFPELTNTGGISTLTFTLTNPSGGAVTGVNFIDPLPSIAAGDAGDMVVASPTGATTSNCGTPTFAPTAGTASLSFSGGTIPGNSSCTVAVNVIAPTTGNYKNTSNTVKVGSIDTLDSAYDELDADTTTFPTPTPPAACTTPITLATWNNWNYITTTGVPDSMNALVSAATASFSGTGNNFTTDGNPADGWYGTGWSSTSGASTSSTPAYFQFSLDTSNYGGARIAFDYLMTPNGDWAANNNNNVYVYSQANSGAFSSAYGAGAVNKGNWGPVTANATATGNGTTTFRINADTRNKTTAEFVLDNVIISGCARPNPPEISKAFSPSPVATGGTSTLTLTIANKNTDTHTNYNYSNISFTDAFPGGMTYVSTTSNSCGGSLQDAAGNSLASGDVGIKLTGGTLNSNGGTATCEVVVVVAVPSNAPGPYANVTGFVSATVGGTTSTNTTATGSAAATLIAVAPPVIDKNFAPNPILAGGVSTLSFLIANPNPDNALSGVSFSDTFPTSPTNMVVASTSVNSATIAVTNGSANVTGTNTSFLSRYLVGDRIRIAGSYYTILSIASDTSLTLTAPYAGATASGLSIIASMTSDCGAATFAPAAGAGSINFSAGNLAAGSSCTVRVEVTAPTAGSYVNTSGAVSHSLATGSSIATDTLLVNTPTPAFKLSKEVAKTNGAPIPWSSFVSVNTGDNIWFRFVVENMGDTPLTEVRVTDPAPYLNLNSCVWRDGDGDLITLYQLGGINYFDLPVAVTSNDNHIAYCVLGSVSATPAGLYENTATVAAKSGGSPVPYNAYDHADTARFATVGLSLTKNANKAFFLPPSGDPLTSDVITYSFVVSNSGYAALFAPVIAPITINDAMTGGAICPSTTTVGDGDSYLDPGESLSCTATYTVTAANITAKSIANSATASVAGVTSNTATHTLYLAPDLSAVKTNNTTGDKVIAGESFTWTVTVRNDLAAGNATFTTGATILTDNLPPVTDATYTLAALYKSGIGGTGTLDCSIATNDLTCFANGGTVTIPSTLAGTVAVVNGSPTVVGTGTTFTTDLSAGSILSLAGSPYIVATIIDNVTLTLTSNYLGADDPLLKIPASFSVLITVASKLDLSLSYPLALNNPRSGGVCLVDPDSILFEISADNNSCSNTVTARVIPVISVIKTVSPYSDPINGMTNPKTIPGSFMTYRLEVRNSGLGSVDAGTTVLTDKVPDNAELFVGDVDGAGSPVVFTDTCVSTSLPDPASTGLSFTFAGLDDTGDSLKFSKSITGATYDDPADLPIISDANGCDPAVKYFRVALNGPFLGKMLSTDNKTTSFCLEYRVRLQ